MGIKKTKCSKEDGTDRKIGGRLGDMAKE